MIVEGARVNDMNFQADDEPIKSKKIEFASIKDLTKDGQNEEIDMSSFLNIEFKTKLKNLKFTKNIAPKEIPVVLEVKSHEPGFLQGHLPRVPIDLICVIDKSGSMLFDEKMVQLKRTLSDLLKFLLPNDRLCLIQYDSKAKRLTNLRCATPENLEYFEEVIEGIEASGGTSIVDGLLVAKKVIEQRREKNKVCSIFLLSDGDDPEGLNKMEKVIKIYNDQFKGEVSINSFGFGDECNEDLLSVISDRCGGLFYYVDDDEDLDDMFVDCLGRMVSVLGQRAKLEVKLELNEAFPEIRFSKTFGDDWNGDSEIKREIDIGYIIAGATKNYVFKVIIPFNNNYELEETKTVRIASAKFFAESFLSNDQGIIPFNSEAAAEINLICEEIKEEPNEDVEIEVMRVETAEAQKIMFNMISNKQEKQAQELHGEWMNRLLEQGKKKYSSKHPIFQNCVTTMNEMQGYISTKNKKSRVRGKKKMFHNIRSQYKGVSKGNWACYQNSTQMAFRNRLRSYRNSNDTEEE